MPTASAPVTLIPFRRRFDHILVDAQVNGVPATLAVDTGSGSCALDADWARMLDLASARTAQAFGSDTVRVSLATIDSLRIGTLDLGSQLVPLVPLGEVSARHGVPIHGTIGFPFFDTHVVEIDYDACLLHVYDPGSFVYDGHGTRLPIDITTRLPVLDATLVARNGERLPARLLLDLGTGGYASVLTRGFVERHTGALTAGPSIERTLGAGVGGTIAGRVASLEAMELGDLRVPAPIVAMPAEGKGFFGVTWADGTLGAPVLSRARVILDYPHKEVIIEPGNGFGDPFPYDASGLTLRATGEALEVVVVDDVRPGSPADQAGLTAGTVIVSVNGSDVRGEAMEWMVKELSAVGRECAIVIETDGQRRSVMLDLVSNGLS